MSGKDWTLVLVLICVAYAAAVKTAIWLIFRRMRLVAIATFEPYKSAQCRRCAECADSEHHWIENPDFGNFDPDDAQHPPSMTHICKHCPATGMECEHCDGDGCDECKQAGVCVSVPF